MLESRIRFPETDRPWGYMLGLEKNDLSTPFSVIFQLIPEN